MTAITLTNRQLLVEESIPHIEKDVKDICNGIGKFILVTEQYTQMSTPFKGETLHREVYVNPQMIIEMKEA